MLAMSQTGDYRDAGWLREQYTGLGREAGKIADECGVHRSTIYNWLEKHGIPRDRGPGYRTDDPEPYRDADWLRKKYWEEKLSSREIADLADCSGNCIRRWMDRHGIKRRSIGEAKGKHVGTSVALFRTDLSGGYEVWNAYAAGDVQEKVFVHRLLAVAEHGFDALDGMHVHHENGIPWDNRPDNLKLMTPSEHSELHQAED